MSFAHATPAQQESPGFSRGEDVKALNDGVPLGTGKWSYRAVDLNQSADGDATERQALRHAVPSERGATTNKQSRAGAIAKVSVRHPLPLQTRGAFQRSQEVSQPSLGANTIITRIRP